MNLSSFLTLLISILTMSGCFKSPSENKKQNEEMVLLWDYAYDLDGGAPRVIPAIVGQFIITSGDTKITSLDYENGNEIWKTPFSYHRQLSNRVFGTNENIVAGSILKKIMAWDVNTGTQLWEVSIHDSLSFNNFGGVTTGEDFFVVFGDYSELFKISLNGNLSHYNLNSRAYESTLVGDYLYLGQRRMISALDIKTMQPKWEFEVQNFGIFALMPPIVKDNRVYLGSVYGTPEAQQAFFALDASTGQEIWRRQGILTFHAVSEGDYIYVNNGGGIVKLRKSDGQIMWDTHFNAGSGTAPIAYGYGHIYAPHSGRMHVVDAETGEVVHKFDSPKGSPFWLVTAGAGRIFAQSNRHLYAFAPWGHDQPLEE